MCSRRMARARPRCATGSRSRKRRNGYAAVYRARQRVHPVTREELDAITNTWVDAALRLEDRDLKMMGRIVRAQMRRMEGSGAADIATEALAEEALAATADAQSAQPAMWVTNPPSLNIWPNW